VWRLRHQRHHCDSRKRRLSTAGRAAAPAAATLPRPRTGRGLAAPELVQQQAAEEHLGGAPEREPGAKTPEQKRRAPMRRARRVRDEGCARGREQQPLGHGRVREAAGRAAAHGGWPARGRGGRRPPPPGSPRKATRLCSARRGRRAQSLCRPTPRAEVTDVLGAALGPLLCEGGAGRRRIVGMSSRQHARREGPHAPRQRRRETTIRYPHLRVTQHCTARTACPKASQAHGQRTPLRKKRIEACSGNQSKSWDVLSYWTFETHKRNRHK
jgi:hypothetical protein